MENLRRLRDIYYDQHLSLKVDVGRLTTTSLYVFREVLLPFP
jgi:hypothetical protein